jgi:hypothetical protein
MITGPHSGRVRIRVGSGTWHTVDTYSPTVRRRVVVYRGPLLGLTRHSVTIQNLATSGRPYAYLDGVAFLP